MTSTGEPVVLDDPDASRFELRYGDDVAGYLEYRREGGTLALVHTLIEEQYGGRGLGSVLARGVLDAAREAGEAVLPYCPFVRRYLERHPDDLDLVPAERRAEMGLPADEGPR